MICWLVILWLIHRTLKLTRLNQIWGSPWEEQAWQTWCCHNIEFWIHLRDKRQRHQMHNNNAFPNPWELTSIFLTQNQIENNQDRKTLGFLGAIYCIERKIKLLNATFVACFDHVGSPIRCWKRASKISSMLSKRKSSLLHQSGASRIAGAREIPCMNAMDQRRKLQKMCLTYRLCATPLHAPPTQHLLAKRFTAFAPLCLPKP